MLRQKPILIEFVAYPVVLIAGIPVFMLLRRKNWLSPGAFILSGLLPALIALAFVIAAEQHMFVGESGPHNIAGLVLLMVVSGVVGGLTFMKLPEVMLKNPNRCRPASADFLLGATPNAPLQRDATPASRLRAPELAR